MTKYDKMSISNDKVDIFPEPNSQQELLKKQALEIKQKSQELAVNKKNTEQLLASISSALIGLGADNRVTRWNASAERTFGMKTGAVVGELFSQSGIKWDWTTLSQKISQCQTKQLPVQVKNFKYSTPGGKMGLLGFTIHPFSNEPEENTCILILADEMAQGINLANQLTQAQKLESIGQLAAGIAHEINTPIQYIGDNIHFLQDAFRDLNHLITQFQELLKYAKSGAVSKQKVKIVSDTVEESDLPYLIYEIPNAIQESLEGVERVAKIVNSMKEFSHPGIEEKILLDINKSIESTITVSCNEWKYIAELKTDFDPYLPPVPCLPGEFNQVILNLIINAVDAITDIVGTEPEQKGRITISTRNKTEWVEIRVQDTGSGIPMESRPNIFDPFFTTKEIGKGTGQGLAISYNVVVEKHGGALTFESEVGQGSTFIIQLPLKENQKIAGEPDEEAHLVCG